MKKIKYKFLSCQINEGTEENPVMVDVLKDKILDYTEANLEVAKLEAVGDIVPFDDGQSEVYQPTQLDMIEAQVAYTALMTDTLLEV